MTLNEWMEGQTEKAGSMTGSAVRLALQLSRNLSGIPFARRMTQADRNKVNDQVAAAVEAVNKDGTWHFDSCALSGLSETERQVLSDRGLHMPEGEALPASRFYYSDDGTFAIVTNGEDHVMLYAFCRDGEAVSLWRRLSRLDDALNGTLNYAYDKEFGYLTTSPGLTGTGLKIAETVFLPGVYTARQIRPLERRLSASGYTIRAMAGRDNSWCPLFMVGNASSMGTGEEILCNRLEEVMKNVEFAEEKYWKDIWDRDEAAIRDQVWRSIGTLKYARRLNAAETITCLSWLRTGIRQKIISGIDRKVFEQLWSLASSAFVAWKVKKDELSPEETDTWRSVLIRDVLKDILI
jgi:protein arginine kinase